jgi:hypothetical protein
MLYLSRPNGTHAVFPSERRGAEGYIGAFDVVMLVPGAGYSDGYPDGTFIGNRKSLDEAQDWADTCDLVNAPRPRAPAWRRVLRRLGVGV